MTTSTANAAPARPACKTCGHETYLLYFTTVSGGQRVRRLAGDAHARNAHYCRACADALVEQRKDADRFAIKGQFGA